MRNPIKSLSHGIKKKLNKKHHVHNLSADAKRLIEIWPDGTWNYQSPRADQVPNHDNNVRAVIHDSWARAEFYAAEKDAGQKLNPGMFGEAGPIPAGWYPSGKALKNLPKIEPHFMHYIVGQLTHLGHIRP